jgi:hypothetical protein
MRQAADVAIVADGVARVADRLLSAVGDRPAWRVPPHWWSGADPAATATYVLLLDALNFSFWGAPRWQIAWQGERLNGYWALAAALRRVLDAGVPLLDADFLLAEADAAELLAGEDGVTIPLLDARQRALREVGQGLRNLGADGIPGLVAAARGRVAALLPMIPRYFASFQDVALYRALPVPLYKRTQILVADLWGAFEGRGLGSFQDLDALTMFADYKVPQVLHGLGVLRYSPGLAAKLASLQPLPPDDPREVEIRAASVQAVEALADALAERGQPMTPLEIDWRLWSLGQSTEWPLPYHRTRTTAY